MTYHNNVLPLLPSALLCLALVGCGSIGQPFPEKEFFGIDAGDSPAPAKRMADSGLRVRRLRIAPPYDGRSFVYKVGESRYKTDYYNGFVTSPDHLLTGELTQWLTEAKLFAAVVGSTGEADHRYVLDGSVSELYGDFTDANAPKAVIKARFFLLDDSQAETKIVFQKTYRKEAPLSEANPEAVAAGLGAAFREVLTELTADISRTRLVPDARTAGKQCDRQNHPTISSGTSETGDSRFLRT